MNQKSDFEDKKRMIKHERFSSLEDVSLDEMIDLKVKNLVFQKLVKDYYEFEGMDEAYAKISFADLSLYDDILNEFLLCLSQKSYDFSDALVIEGYTAKMIHEKKETLKPSEIYEFLKTLRENPKDSKKLLEEIFAKKDIFPPTPKHLKQNKSLRRSERNREGKISLLHQEYDYSKILPTLVCVSYLIQYCDTIYQNFKKLVMEDEEKNKKLKAGFKNFQYKKTNRSNFHIYIRRKHYEFRDCKNYESFRSAVSDGGMKKLLSLEIKMNLDFDRGLGANLEKHENSFTILFLPYEITFTRDSNYYDETMNQVEENIRNILEKFPIAPCIFCE